MNYPNLSLIKNIIFDFDGVLCKDRFYSSLDKLYPKIHDYVEKKIFKGDTNLVDRWMRNEIDSDHINKMISQHNSISFDEIKNIFEKDVLNMKIDQRLIEFARQQLRLNRKLALVTNNMDVFSTLTIKNHKLDEIFEVIINSADYGLLKTDENGKLFDIALEKMDSNDYNSTLLIDDSSRVELVFKAKGGHVFRYSNFEEFISWAELALT